MWIFTAGTGLQYEVDVPATATVATLKEVISTLVDIPEDSQILLCGKVKLNSNRTLLSYNLPSNDKPIFVFNRKAFDVGAKIPEDTILVVPNETVPQSTFSLQELAKPPELYKLRLNDHKFRGNLLRAESLKSAIDKRVELSKQCFAQHQVQANALSTAIEYTNTVLDSLKSELTPAIAAHNSLVEKNERLLSTFNADLAKLREIVPHPALRVHQQSLSEIVNEPQVRAFAEKCSKEHYQLKEKMTKFVKDVEQVQPLDGVNWSSFESLQKNMDRMFEIEAHTSAVSGAIAKDCKVMDEDLSTLFNLLSSRGGTLDDALNSSINKLQEISDKTLQGHINYLRLLEEWNKESASVLAAFATSKTRLSKEIHQHMQPIALMSAKLNDMGAFLYRLKQALGRQKTDIEQLKFVEGFPGVYQDCLEEVSRRRSIARRYNNEMTKVKEKTTRFLEAEKKRREAFLKSHAQQIPQLLHDLIPGLLESLPLSGGILDLQQLDAKLPAIDLPQTPEATGDDDFIISQPPTAPKSPPPPPPRVQSLEASQSFMQDELVKVRKERDSYKERIQNLERKLYDAYTDRGNEKDLEEQLSHYEQALKSSSTLLPETMKELELLREDKRQLGVRIQALEEETKLLKKEIAEKEKELNKVGLEREKEKEKQKEVLTEGWEKELKQKEDSIQELRSQLTRLCTQLEEANSNLENLRKEGVEDQKQSALQKEKFTATFLQIRIALEKTGLDFMNAEKKDVATTLGMFQQFVAYSMKLRQILHTVELNERNKISLSNFAVNDLAMFFPREDGLYQAFNKDCPGYFLADESVENFEHHIKRKICIVGEIVQINEVHRGDPGAQEAKLGYYSPDTYFDVIIMTYD